MLLAGMISVLIVLMIVPESFDYRSLVDNRSPASGGIISRILWLVLLGSSLTIICWRAGLAWLLTRAMNPYLPLLMALAVASITWSINPSLSLRRLIRLTTIVLTCASFVLVGWHKQRLQNVVRPLITFMLLGSICFGMAFPALAIHQETAAELAGAWRGLANHKNGLGALASFGMIFWLHAWLTRERTLLTAMGGGVIALICLLLSRSSTSLMATIFASGLLILLLRAPDALRPYLPAFITLLTITLLIYAFALLNLIPGLDMLMSPIAALTNKDASLTGRTHIWTIIADHMRDRPLLGSGYGAYWTAGPVAGTESYAFIWRMGHFYPGSAHNGYLEIANDLGWVGLTGLIAYLIRHARQSIQLLTADRGQAALLLALFFQQGITNFSESHWFSVLSVDFVIMTLATMALARTVLEYRLRAVFGEPSSAKITSDTDKVIPARHVRTRNGIMLQ